MMYIHETSTSQTIQLLLILIQRQFDLKKLSALLPYKPLCITTQ